jgi:hypothetical protein
MTKGRLKKSVFCTQKIYFQKLHLNKINTVKHDIIYFLAVH